MPLVADDTPHSSETCRQLRSAIEPQPLLCGICQNAVAVNQCVMLPCHHAFHRICMRVWSMNQLPSVICPLCHVAVDNIYDLLPEIRREQLLCRCADTAICLTGSVAIATVLFKWLMQEFGAPADSLDWSYRDSVMIGMSVTMIARMAHVSTQLAGTCWFGCCGATVARAVWHAVNTPFVHFKALAHGGGFVGGTCIARALEVMARLGTQSVADIMRILDSYNRV